MKLKTRLLSTILAALLPVADAATEPASFKITESEGRLDITANGKLVTSFRTDNRVPYLYPITSPSGANICRHWPVETDAPTEERDHPHHRGLRLAHGRVNGNDFWTDFPTNQAVIKFNSFSGQEAGATNANFTADLTWHAYGEDILHETRSHNVSRPDPETLRIDVTSNLSALDNDVTMGDTKEGTFAIRVDRSLRVEGSEAKATLINSKGLKNGKVWGKTADWAAFVGPDELGEPVVVAIIEHPDSFRHPTYWHAREYGLLAANPFGLHEFESSDNFHLGDHVIEKGETLTLKYSVIIHHGNLESANLADVVKSIAP